MPRRRLDPLGRQTLLAIAAGRIAIGVGAVFVTRPALKALGFTQIDSANMALGRMAGGRDLALGLLTVAAHDDAANLRTVALATAAVDAADAVAFGFAARDPDARQAGVGGAVLGSAAALAGAWAWRRLRDF
jgi:hypothetical protein